MNWLGEDYFGFAHVMLYLVVLFLEEHSLVDVRDNTTENQVVALIEVFHFFTAIMYLLMSKNKVHKRKHKIIIILFSSCCHRLAKQATLHIAPQFIRTD